MSNSSRTALRIPMPHIRPARQQAGPLLQRCANQAARAIVREVERETGKNMPLSDCIALVYHIGHALQSDTFNSAFPQHLRRIFKS